VTRSGMRTAAKAPERRGLRLGDLARLLVTWALSSLALMLAAWLQPNLSATSPWAYVAVAAVSGLVGFLVRPLLVEVSARIGWIAVLPLALVGQAVVMYLAMIAVPGITTTFWAAVVSSWICAALGTLIAYVMTAGTDDGLTSSLARRGRRPAPVPDPDVEGMIVVQMDGVPFPVLQWAVQSGAVPTIRRWLSTGGYELREWTPQLPCTTPASQLGLLHGTVDGVPAFRWYDRELGRVLVANRPADARVIEERATTGRGLLAEDGVSVSNLFSGDAARSPMTMSRVGASRGTPETRRAVAWFLLSPGGFSRSFSRTVAEIVKERWQARRQERRRFEPRVKRGWTFALLRAVTNALLRDLNTALVADEMKRGTKVVYVDYVDYDEIAHHAGMYRPESLAALDGVDGVLAQLELLASNGARRYRIAVVSDHGQSQGRSFADRFGIDLGALCARLTAVEVQSVQESVEGWGRADSIVQDLGQDGLPGRISKTAKRRMDREPSHPAEQTPSEDLVVLGSGNLGLVYVPGPERLSIEELDHRWPELVDGLRTHPGVGFVAGLDRHGTPWALGRSGRLDLSTGNLVGDDPLAPYGEHAARVLRRAVCMPQAPDLYVNSLVDEDTLEVAAFEDLVGAHGGLGGWQDHAVLLAPSDLLDGQPARVEGADQMHQVLLAMLRRCGQRTDRSLV
jgi:uncharacterized membrane protein YvlD (DUF360 family)